MENIFSSAREKAEKAIHANKARMNGKHHHAHGLAVVGADEPMGEEYRKHILAARFDPNGPVPPPRPIIYGSMIARGTISVMGGDSGLGKSTIGTFLAADMATGGGKLGVEMPDGALRVGLLNLEDDTSEGLRLMHATFQGNGFKGGEVSVMGNDYFTSNPPSVIERPGSRSGEKVFNEAFGQRLRDIVTVHGLDVLIVDPLAATTGGEELSPAILNLLARGLVAEVAKPMNCAILLVHHTRKMSSAGGDPGGVDELTGGKTLKDTARTVVMLAPMRQEDAENFGVSEEDRGDHVRMRIEKTNLGRHGKTFWFRKVGTTLQHTPSDEAALPVSYPLQFAQVYTPPDQTTGLIPEIWPEIRKRLETEIVYASPKAQKSKTRLRDVVLQAAKNAKIASVDVVGAIDAMRSAGWIASEKHHVGEQKHGSKPVERAVVGNNPPNPDQGDLPL